MQEWSVSLLCAGSTPKRSSASVNAVGGSLLLQFGGRDAAGAPTDDLYSLDLGKLSATGQGWRLVETSGDAPSPRWGHSACVYQQQLYVYGGFGQGAEAAALLEDMHRLDLATWQWQRVQQGGTRPNRQLGKHRSFHVAVASPAGHSMLAFGVEQEDDENADPQRPRSSPCLRLFSFDLTAHKWSVVHTSGSVAFTKLEALQVHGSKLIAMGWTPAASAKSDSNMQVCVLDLSSFAAACKTPSFKFGSTPAASAARSRLTPSWKLITPAGMVPSARTAAASAVLGNKLLLHGGMLCSSSVQGWLAADSYCLSLQDSWSWTRLAPSQERAVGSSTMNAPRASHRAVSVPSASTVMLLGGTSSRQLAASFDTIVCMRLLQDGPTASADSSRGATHGIDAMLSATPTLLGIHQPVGHVTGQLLQPAAGTPHTATAATPGGSTSAAVTPAVHLATTPRADAAAAAAAATAAAAAPIIPTYDFAAFLNTTDLSDIVLVAGGRSFAAHRVLLCAQSPRLAQLIKGQQVPGAAAGAQTPILTLPDLYPDVLSLMLEYLYCRLTAIPVESAPLLFKAADRYGLPGLRATALKVVIASISLETVCHTVLLAHDHTCSELWQACIVFAAATQERFQQILSTAGWLHLNAAHPRVGTMFVQAVTQLMMQAK